MKHLFILLLTTSYLANAVPIDKTSTYDKAFVDSSSEATERPSLVPESFEDDSKIVFPAMNPFATKKKYEEIYPETSGDGKNVSTEDTAEIVENFSSDFENQDSSLRTNSSPWHDVQKIIEITHSANANDVHEKVKKNEDQVSEIPENSTNTRAENFVKPMMTMNSVTNIEAVTENHSENLVPNTNSATEGNHVGTNMKEVSENKYGQLFGNYNTKISPDTSNSGSEYDDDSLEDTTMVANQEVSSYITTSPYHQVSVTHPSVSMTIFNQDETTEQSNLGVAQSKVLPNEEGTTLPNEDTELLVQSNDDGFSNLLTTARTSEMQDRPINPISSNEFEPNQVPAIPEPYVVPALPEEKEMNPFSKEQLNNESFVVEVEDIAVGNPGGSEVDSTNVYTTSKVTEEISGLKKVPKTESKVPLKDVSQDHSLDEYTENESSTKVPGEMSGFTQVPKIESIVLEEDVKEQFQGAHITTEHSTEFSGFTKVPNIESTVPEKDVKELFQGAHFTTDLSTEVPDNFLGFTKVPKIESTVLVKEIDQEQGAYTSTEFSKEVPEKMSTLSEDLEGEPEVSIVEPTVPENRPLVPKIETLAPETDPLVSQFETSTLEESLKIELVVPEIGPLVSEIEPKVIENQPLLPEGEIIQDHTKAVIETNSEAPRSDGRPINPSLIPSSSQENSSEYFQNEENSHQYIEDVRPHFQGRVPIKPWFFYTNELPQFVEVYNHDPFHKMHYFVRKMY